MSFPSPSPYLAWSVQTIVLEVEVKVELMAPGILRERLRQAGATQQSLEEHDDVFYASGDRDVIATDEALRLRTTEGRMTLTYKGPRLGTDAKARVEEEVEVSSNPSALLAHLGWIPSARLKKRREPWSLEDVQVTIDTLDGLGTFAEVEVVSDDLEAASATVGHWLKVLGLEGAQRFSMSYLEMAAKAGLDVTSN